MYVQCYGTPGTEIEHDSQAAATAAAAEAAASVKDSFQEDSRSSDDDDANVTRVDIAKNQNKLSNQKTLSREEDTIELYNNIARYNLIDTKYRQMAFQFPSDGAPISPNQPSFGTPGQTKVSGHHVTSGRQHMKFVV